MIVTATVGVFPLSITPTVAQQIIRSVIRIG